MEAHVSGVALGAAEAIGLQAGLRDAFRLRLPASELPRWRRAVARRGWACAEVEDAVAATAGGHWVRSEEAGVHVFVVARDAAVAAAVVALERDAIAAAGLRDAADLRALIAAHHALGRHYGYPSCCVAAFVDAHLEVVAGLAPRVGDNLVAIARAVGRSRLFDARLDVLESDWLAPQRSPLRPLPCRFDCAASIALADRLIAAGAGAGDRHGSLGALVAADGRVHRAESRDAALALAEPAANAATNPTWARRLPLWLPFRAPPF
ncbi:MAG: hypothetical protein RIT45_972 [Pseudomonadota bacterium]|jgi:hypothetical protein